MSDEFINGLQEDKVVERVKLADHPNRFVKVAFDLFRDNTTDFVWKTEAAGDDGQVWLVRSEEQPEQSQVKQAGNWMAVVDRSGNNITLAYKGRPLQRFASSDYKFTKDTSEDFAGFLVRKAESKDFVQRMFSLFPENKRNELVAQYPELR
jgi:hypothetical protein